MSRFTGVVMTLVVLGLLGGGYWLTAYADQPDHPATGEAQAHVVVLPERIQWQPGPPSLPPGAHFAVLEGDPGKPGIFTMRIRVPQGYRIPPHTHQRVERVTVLDGTLRLGQGATFDEQHMQRLPAGAFFAMPPGMQHYAAAEDQTVIQLTGQGPWEIHYINPADDPRGGG